MFLVDKRESEKFGFQFQHFSKSAFKLNKNQLSRPVAFGRLHGKLLLTH